MGSEMCIRDSCQGGEAFYRAVAQILVLLIVWARQRYIAVFTAVGAAITLRRGQMLLKFSPLVYTSRGSFYCCWCCYYTTARVNAGQIFAVGVGVMLRFLLLLMLQLHYGEGKCWPNFRRWCRRYDTVFTAVGAITLWRGQMLPKFSPLV